MKQAVSIAGVFLGVISAAGADAGEAALVVFEKPGCGWCEAWERDVGRVYDRTDEGRLLPLRRVDLGQPLPEEYRSLKAIAFTPTFVVTRCGAEAGRITGYPGEAHFYALLNEIIVELKLGDAKAC
ncbi:MAG: thioredoxin [Rhodospirillales bacterium]|nr:thioredoxin [Rhodospirillales bacterium]